MIAHAEIERFGKDVAFKRQLRDELKALGTTDHKTVVEFANKKGYHFSLEDVKALEQSGEVSELRRGGVTADFTEVLFVGSGSGYALATGHKALVWY